MHPHAVIGAVPKHPVVSREGLRKAPTSVPSVADGAHTLWTRSGRSAIVLALRASGIGGGMPVLVPDYYCPTMIAPVELVGAQPVFYPLTARGEPDLEALRRIAVPQGAALLAAHFFGLPISMRGVREFCDQRQLTLIEDCAHAFFGERDGVPVGSVGDYAIASLPKFFPVLEGGLLASRKPAPAVALPAASARAEIKGLWNIAETAAGYRRLPLLGGAVRLAAKLLSVARRETGDDVDAAPGRPPPQAVRAEALADPLLAPARLRRVERWLVDHTQRARLVDNRRRNYLRLAERFAAVRGCRVLFPSLEAGAVPYVLPLHVAAAESVYPVLRTAGLPVFRWDRYWPGSPSAAGLGALDWGHHVIQISCHQDLTSANVDTMAQQIEAAIRQAQHSGA
jgi:hypothetical protein